MNETRQKREAERHKLELRILANVSSIGTSDLYEFRTKDISEIGALMCHKDGRSPFNQSSILEVRLTPEEEASIAFLAKIVRFATTDCIAIRIVQIEDGAKQRLKRLIESRTEKKD